ncbi:MAG: protein kinase family protein [Eggerthella lenta]
MRHAARLARFATAAGDRRRVGRTFGAWRLDAVLGQGRFGTCFRASRASGEPRSAALKLIKPEQGSLDRDALWREAKALSLCAHPAVPRWLGIVRERDDARDRGRCFMAQSLMPGTSLDRLLFRQRRSFDQAAIASIGRQVIDALAHLEGRGVAHGDVRPANLLIDDEGRRRSSTSDWPASTERGEPGATATDRAGLADACCSCCTRPRRSRRGGSAQLPWFDDLTSGRPALPLLDLFSDDPRCSFASIGNAFEEAFAAPPTAWR